MFARGYFPGRSGQVFVVPKEKWFVTVARSALPFMHGSPWDYDTHIPGAVLRRAVRQGRRSVPRRGDATGHRADDRRADRRAVAADLHRPRRSPKRSPASARPRVVTVIVLDAMRADYFDKYAVGDADADAHAQGRRVVLARRASTALPTVTGVGHANIGTGSEPALPRHRRQHPVQPRDRQVAGGLRSARYARADGADARRRVEPAHRRQGGDHRPGRRDPRRRRTGRTRRAA